MSVQGQKETDCKKGLNSGKREGYGADFGELKIVDMCNPAKPENALPRRHTQVRNMGKLDGTSGVGKGTRGAQSRMPRKTLRKG